MRRAAFTLFEVLVVLSLSAVIMLMVGSAIQLHLRMTDSSGDAVKNAQLARVILRQISNDLRAATFGDRVSTSSAGTAEEGDSNDAGSTADEDSSGGSFAVGNSSDSTGSPSSANSDDDMEGQQIDAATQTAPGIYGDAEQIRIDMVRAVDTRDWFATWESATPVIDASVSPRAYGGLQTVAYFLQGNSNASATAGTIEPTMEAPFSQDFTRDSSQVGGLVRQVVDHPVASWALENGGGSELDTYSKLFAPEVMAVTFRYFDGTQWSDVWDSYELGGLPVAVEVTLMLAPRLDSDNASFLYQGLQDPDSVYTMVVHIPTGLPTDETEAQL